MGHIIQSKTFETFGNITHPRMFFFVENETTACHSESRCFVSSFWVVPPNIQMNLGRFGYRFDLLFAGGCPRIFDSKVKTPFKNPPPGKRKTNQTMSHIFAQIVLGSFKCHCAVNRFAF